MTKGDPWGWLSSLGRGKAYLCGPRRQAVGAHAQGHVAKGPAYFPFHLLKSISVSSLQLHRILKRSTSQHLKNLCLHERGKVYLPSPSCPQTCPTEVPPPRCCELSNKQWGGEAEPCGQVPTSTTSGHSDHKSGGKTEGGKDKNESKNKPQAPPNTFHPNKDKCDRPNSSRGRPLQTVLSCPRQMSRERSSFGDRPWVSPDSSVMGTVSGSLSDSRHKDDDTVGTVPVDGAPLDAAALGRASRLLLEHVDGVFVLHLQLRGGVCLVDRLPVKPEPDLPH